MIVMKPEPVWSEIPEHLRIFVAEMLDVKSRISLGQCSRSDYSAISKIPFSMRTIGFGFEGRHGDVQCIFNSQNIQKKDPEDVILGFKRILKNPRSKIETLIFGCQGDDVFYSRILKETPRNSIKVKSVIFNGFNSSFGDLHLNLLRLMDPRFLKVLKINLEIFEEMLEELVKLDHWKRLEKLNFGNLNLEFLKIEHFLHINQLELDGLKRIEKDDAMKMTEALLSRPIPNDSYFSIRREVPNVFFGNSIRLPREEIGKFEIPDSRNILQVERHAFGIQGQILNIN